MSKFKRFGKLPGQPSKLIRLAIKDLEAVEGDTRYMVDMRFWHLANYDSCHVCLAGSVMAKTLNIPEYMYWDGYMSTVPGYLRKTVPALHALNYLRIGYLALAFEDLEIPFPKTMKPAVSVTNYATDPVAFKADMLDLARQLEERGY